MAGRKKATGAFQNDVFLGGRLALNDPQDTSLLFGVIEDLTYRTRLLSLEATRRLGDRFTIGIEARLFTNVDQRDTLDGFARRRFDPDRAWLLFLTAGALKCPKGVY